MKQCKIKLVFAALITMVMLPGIVCAGGQSSQASSREEPAEKLMYHFLMPEQPDQEMVFEEANKYIREKIGVEIDFISMGWGDYFQKMNLALTANEDLDVFWSCHWMQEVRYSDYARRGMILPIDDLLPEYAPKTYAFLSQFVNGNLWDYMRVSTEDDPIGKIYGVFSFQQLASARGMWFKKELTDKYDFDVSAVEKYTDIEPFIEKVKQNEENIIPICLDYEGFVSVLPFSGADEPIKQWPSSGNAYVTYAEPEVVKCTIYEPFNIDDYKKTVEWLEKGYISRDAMAIKDEQAEAKTGRYACGFIGGYLPDTTPSLTAKYKFPVETIPLGDMVFDGQGPKATVNCISRNCSNPQKAMEFIELLNTDKYLYNLLVYGIEDVHYKKIGENRIESVENTGYNAVGTRWVIGNTTNMYLLPGFDEDMNKIAIEYSLDPIVEINSDFSFNSEPIQDTAMAWDTYVKNYIVPIRVGVLPSQFSSVEEVFDFLAEEGKPYLDAEMAEFRKQYAEYLAAKE